MEKYDPNTIEKKWQKIWEESKTHQAADFSKKKKYYCLDMFPYPSGEGLHVGHWRGYVFSDVWSRYQKMRDKNVLHPIGFDAFGLPAENAAIKTKMHPKTHIKETISRFEKQLKDIGAMYDWSREVITSEPEYYKWTQWLFLQLYQNGLAYRDEAFVNFCPNCQTVLANEQVKGGLCERCDSIVQKKKLKQWFFKISKYAQQLLDDLHKIDWPERVKLMQRHWIGKSEGALVKFKIVNCKLKIENCFIDVFTTRPDTLFGASFLVLAPEHELTTKITTVDKAKSVEKYVREALKVSEIDRSNLQREKTGVFTGAYAINPITKSKIPIWVADYVLSNYGTGAIMSVPAHDQRDFDFAKKFNLPIIQVISAPSKKQKSEKTWESDGIMINSGQFNGINSQQAKSAITEYLEKNKLGISSVNYKLKDWLISRQRYWGAPIPIIYCRKCWELKTKNEKRKTDFTIIDGKEYAIIPVPEEQLPVLLPEKVDFKPTGESPLARTEEFLNTKCPKCKGPAKRETDTMDTFVCSSWYFLRFCDPKNKKKFADKTRIKYWMPVDFYVGGIEHATMHLLYARFITHALHSLGLLDFNEPFLKLYTIGMIYLHGAKMSKSRGNIISPDEIIQKYGTDTLRGYELFVGPTDEDSEWNVNGVNGVYRFLQKVYTLVADFKEAKSSVPMEQQTHQLIKRYTDDLLRLNFNTLISHLMSFVNLISKKEAPPTGVGGIFSSLGRAKEDKNQCSKFQIETLIKLLSPIAPHLAEELWQKIGNEQSVFESGWPSYDQDKIASDTMTLVIQVNGKVRDTIVIKKNDSKANIIDMAIKRQDVQKWIVGNKIKKTVYIPFKLINFVV